LVPGTETGLEGLADVLEVGFVAGLEGFDRGSVVRELPDLNSCLEGAAAEPFLGELLEPRSMRLRHELDAGVK
jgi:hypothetical protein